MNGPLTREYGLGRADISLNYAIEYLRTFWWAIAGVPVFGLVCLILGRDAVVQAFGLVCLLWPLTIPARAFLLTSKASRQMMKPTTLEISEDCLLFSASDGTGTRLHTASIRSIRRRGGQFVIRTRMLAMSLVPVDAFLGDEELKAFLALAPGD